MADAVTGLHDITREYTPRALPPYTPMRDALQLAKTPLPMLFNGSMPLGEMSAIGSEPGCGKTYWSIGLGLSLVFFKTIFPGFVPCRPGRVLMLLAEDMKHATALRLDAWCKQQGISEAQYQAACDDGRLTFICGESAELLTFERNVCTRTQAFHDLKADCESQKWDLIIVDSLMQWSGLSDDNINAQMHAIGAALVELARTTGGVTLALCHTTKADARTGKATLSAFRGGGAFAGKMRWGAIMLEFSDEDVKHYGIPKSCQKNYLKLECVKSQYGPQFAEPQVYERGPGGALEAVKLRAPKPEDALLELARALAKGLGENPARLAKWDLLQKKLGADFRAELKLRHGKDATYRNIGLAYEVAVARGLIVEDETDTDAHGQVAKVPRAAIVEES